MRLMSLGPLRGLEFDGAQRMERHVATAQSFQPRDRGEKRPEAVRL